MRRISWAAAIAPVMLAGLALLLATPATSQPAPVPGEPGLPRLTTLYLHSDGIQAMPITSLPPPDWYSGDEEFFGLATHTMTCLPPVPGTSLTSQEWHTLYGYGLRGHVDYSGERPGSFADDYGTESLFGAVPLLGERMTLHWYWETRPPEPTGVADPQPLLVPGVVVEATLRAAAAPFTQEFGDFDEGEVLAHGRTEPALLAADESTGVSYENVGGRHVYHFEVPLDVQAPALPASGYALRIDTYVQKDGCPTGGSVMPNVLAPHTSLGHRPRLELVAADEPRVEVAYAGLGLNGTPGRIVVHANVTSPWGDHEVQSVELAITGPGEASYVWQMPLVPRFHCHCPPEPLQTTWVWDADADRAPPGTYMATVTATTMQGKVTVAQRPFEVEGDRDAAGLGTPLLLLGLVAAAGLALRRRRP